jgi:outer membrane biosynthesis protein TonB
MARLRTWLIASVLVHLLILIVTAVGYRPEKRRVTQPIAVRQLAPSVLKKQGTAAPLPLPPAPEVAQEEAVEEEPVAEAVEPEPVSPVAVAPTPPQKEIAKPAPKPSQKEVAKAEPKKTTKPSPKKTPVAKPKTPPKPAVAAKPKTPTQSAVTAKAPVKPAAKPMATKTTAKPAAAKPTASLRPSQDSPQRSGLLWQRPRNQLQRLGRQQIKVPSRRLSAYPRRSSRSILMGAKAALKGPTRHRPTTTAMWRGALRRHCASASMEM